jgi:hypothetical protein
MSYARVQAVSPGFYGGNYYNIGDVFDIQNAADFQSSAVSTVPPGNPLYPLYGWMKQVPPTTALYSWAAYGNSSPVTGIYKPNGAGAVNLSIPRYVQ